MPLFRYYFTAGALDRIAGNQVAWQAVMFVLTVAEPSIKSHVGAALMQYVAADERGHLLMVTLLEDSDNDDTFGIWTARYLDVDESAAASMLLTPMEN